MRTFVDQCLRHRRLILASMVLGTLAVVAPSRSVRAQTGIVIGRVTDARSGQGMQDVGVQVEGTKLVAGTNIDGRFRLTGVPIGSRVVTVRRIGYTVEHHTVTVSASGETTTDFALQPGAVSLDEVVVTGTAGAQELRSIG